MRYVIIGNSAAAIGTVEGIRKNDAEGEIILISSEPYFTYSRPLISYLLLGKTTQEKMRYRPADFYEKNRCTLLKGKKVIKIENVEHKVILDDGEEISYDKLMVATGSTPFVPPAEGLSLVKNAFTFSSLSDALALEKALDPKKKVLIIGAGLIGLKCAEGIKNLAGDITVVDLSERILSSILDETGAKIVQKRIEEQGISFILNDCVARYEENKAILKSGKEISFDILVLAIGVRPNVSLVKEAGGNVGRGIKIDENCATSLEDIYAAGDCTESFDVSSHQEKIMALLPNAYMQGECAGYHMSGSKKEIKSIPMNSIGLFGLHVMTAGTYGSTAYTENDESHYKKLFYSDNHLTGFILIGDIKRAGIYTSLIREQTDLNTLDFMLICKHPELMAFSKKEREIKLGGKSV